MQRNPEGDEEYDAVEQKLREKKRRYRVAEVRGSWTPEEDATLVTCV